MRGQECGGFGRRVAVIAGTEFLIQMLQMRLDGPGRNKQLEGDLLLGGYRDGAAFLCQAFPWSFG
jgi:hypothetical protein